MQGITKGYLSRENGIAGNKQGSVHFGKLLDYFCLQSAN